MESWDTNHLKVLLTQKVNMYHVHIHFTGIKSACCCRSVEMVRNGVRLSPPPGCPRAIYELMIQCW